MRYAVLAFIVLITQQCHALNYQEKFRQRASFIIDQVADHYTPPSKDIGDPEKYYWPKLMGRFEKYGIKDSLGNQFIDDFKDNSPFHFTLVGMARIMSLYPNAPNMKKYKKRYLDSVWSRDDSYNAWTAEGTENHISMSRTSGYLYAMHAKDYKDFPDAEEKMKKMKKWMRKWSSRIYETGVGEWNSSIYEIYNLIGWLNLYDFARDKEVKRMAKAVLDYYAVEIAQHYMQGFICGSQMRGGSLKSIRSGTSYLAWLWFDDSPVHPSNKSFFDNSKSYIQVMHAITSSYRPPEIARKIAMKKNEKEEYYKNSKPSYFLDKDSYIKQFFYINDDYNLGSAVIPYGGYAGTSYQVINWRYVARTDTGKSAYAITGNGRYFKSWEGENRTPFTQFAQHKNVLIQMTRVPENHKNIYKKLKKIFNKWNKKWSEDFFVRFPKETYKKDVVGINKLPENIKNKSYISFPENVQIHKKGNVLFMKMEDSYLALRKLTDKGFKKISKNKLNRKYVTDKNQFGDLCGFVLEGGSKMKHQSFKNFKTNILNNTKLSVDENNFNIKYISLNGDKIEAKYTIKGDYTEAMVDWGYGPKKPYVYIHEAPFKQPDWPSGRGYGKVPSWSVNGDKINLDEEWPVFSGPHINLKDKVLTLSWEDQTYKVDYTEKYPVFK